MIKIEKVYKTNEANGLFRLNADLVLADKNVTLWYEVDSDYERYLVDDRADAFVVAFINYAMLYKLNIDSQPPVSERLYYNLKQHYIPGLCHNNPVFSQITLQAPTTSIPVVSEHKVGTGMSGGVDSFATYLLNSNKDIPEKFRINQLAFFNVGGVQSSHYKKYPLEQVFQFEDEAIIKESIQLDEKRYGNAKRIADKLGLPIVRVNSNIMAIQKVRHQPLHTQRSVSAVLALQKLFSVYYFAATGGLNQFRIDSRDPAYYDIFSLYMFSTDNLDFISGDLAYNRVRKTKLIAHDGLVQEHLNVCWREEENCGVCGKCIRTLVTLDLLNQLESFAKVFDIQKYYQDRAKYLAFVSFRARKDPFYREIIQHAKTKRISYKGFMFYTHYSFLVAKQFLKKIIRR